MRCVAGAGLVLLVGCNQVFGIGKTEPFDAPADGMPQVRLTWQVASVLPSGDPDPALANVPIEPAPRVRYAALDAPFVDATYEPGDGTILVARELFESDGANRPTWRLEYTLADNLPHEVQWAPEDKLGHLTVPLFGRADRKSVPTGSGYDVAPVGAPALQSPRVFTTGQWTEGLALNHPGATINYDFSSAAAMSGTRARPEPALGDRGVLVDYVTDPDCRYAIGSAVFDATLTGAHSTPAATWDASTSRVVIEGVSPDIMGRFGRGFGMLGGPPSGRFAFGIAAHASMPGLTGIPASPRLPVSATLPTPVMMTLLECGYSGVPPLVSLLVAQPPSLRNFFRMLHVQLHATRTTTSGAVLHSGMATAITASSSDGIQLAFPAAIPTSATLETAAGSLDLIKGPDEASAGAPTGRFTLRFVPEPGGTLRADYHDVTLHRVASGALIPERIYTVTQPSVAIDASLLAPNTEYVFEIRSFKGHPEAARGDFRPVDYPYGSAIVLTRTFRTSA